MYVCRIEFGTKPGVYIDSVKGLYFSLFFFGLSQSVDDNEETMTALRGWAGPCNKIKLTRKSII